MYNIEQFKRDILKKNIASEHNVIGVSSDEIKNLETSLGLTLPIIYKDFLRILGKKAGSLCTDVSFFFHEVATLKEELQEMIDEEELEFTIPELAVVFSGYQGFQYHYFLSDGNENPEIYRIMDDGSPPKKVSNSFTEYLMSIIEAAPSTL